MPNYMLLARDLPSKLWAEAINYETYIQNRVPHRSFHGLTHFEALSGNKLEVTQFGSLDLVSGLAPYLISGKV